MKNFKKVLALVLAVVMLLSFATVASAKIVTSDFYKDTDDIDYTEAVDVLGSIGVLNGFPDDTFRPDATITRAQAAKIIAMFDNGSSSINGLYASANPFTDCVDNWAESFIAYCAKVGIIAGVGGTKFAPDANVTGVQFLKMALVVLGYDAKVEGLEGKNWDVNTLALAKKAGLTRSLGVKFDYSADLKRQEAAVIMLDALRAQTVVYGSALGVNYSKLFEAWDDTTNTFKPVNVNGGLYMTVAGAVQTGDKLGKDWGLTEGYDIDAFYRPYRTWKLDGTEIGRYMFPALAEYTTVYDGCDVLVDLGVAKTNISKSVTIQNHYHNGLEVMPDRDLVLSHTVENTTNGPCEAKDDLENGAQGTLSQVFYIDAAAANELGVDAGYRITEIDTWLGRVTSAKRVSSNRDGHLSYYTQSTIEAYDSNGWTIGDTTTAAPTKDNHGPEVREDVCIGLNEITTTAADGLSTGDYVLFTYSLKPATRGDVGIVDVEVTKPVAGNFNGYKITNYPSQTRVDGEYVMDAAHFHLGYDDSKDSAEFGAKRFFYDAYGNVIGMIDAAGADTDYLVIDRMWVTHDAKGNAVLYADVVGLDAKMTENVVVASAASYDAKWFANEKDREYAYQNSGWYNKLRTFYLNADKEYVISDEVGTTYTNVVIVNGEAEVTTDETHGTFQFAIDSTTQFLIHEKDGSYSAVTGFRKIDSLTAVTAKVIDANRDGVAEIVYLDDVVREGSKVVAYVTSNPDTWEEVDENGATYYKMTVYVKGVATDLYVAKTQYEANFGSATHEEPGFYEFRYLTVGKHTYVEITKTPNDLTAANTEYDVLAMSGNILKYALTTTTDYHYDAVADDVVVYSIRYSIRYNKTVEIEKTDYTANMVVGSKVHLTFNAAGEIAEIYVLENIEY